MINNLFLSDQQMERVKKAFLILIIVSGFLNVPVIVSANTQVMATAAAKDTLDKYAYHKNIPVEFRVPILKTLAYFPELKNVHIKFVIKHAYTPLSTKPSLGSIFKTKNHRTYIVTISNKTIDTLSHLLFKNLTLDEKVGIMGHELSHVVDFDSKNFFQTIANGAGHISSRFLDKMEYNTDLICLQHGLATYLKQYSMHVRKTMHVQYWRGVDHVFEKDDHIERYMNPATIETYAHPTPVSSGNNN